MGLLTLIEIPFHHVLANEIALNLKYRIGLKHFFQVFLVFWVAGSVKSMPSGYSLDAEFNSASNKLSRSKFE